MHLVAATELADEIHRSKGALKSHRISMNKIFKLKICIDIHCVIFRELNELANIFCNVGGVLLLILRLCNLKKKLYSIKRSTCINGIRIHAILYLSCLRKKYN